MPSQQCDRSTPFRLITNGSVSQALPSWVMRPTSCLPSPEKVPISQCMTVRSWEKRCVKIAAISRPHLRSTRTPCSLEVHSLPVRQREIMYGFLASTHPAVSSRCLPCTDSACLQAAGHLISTHEAGLPRAVDNRAQGAWPMLAYRLAMRAMCPLPTLLSRLRLSEQLHIRVRDRCAAYGLKDVAHFDQSLFERRQRCRTDAQA
ncbi:hypothetical protein C7412_115140 [Paraburkholderia silvatlantica]|nr:hypothetical protein C7412_115140 [Paraburkholderia silvatlantica]